MSDIQQIKKLILENAMFYDTQMNEMKLKMHAEVLSEVPISQIEKAYDHFRKLPGQKTLPMPADIKAFTDKKIDPKHEANEAASRIIEAIGKFGYINPVEAYDFIGSLAKRVVERHGGWVSVCQMINHENMSFYKAQFRDLAMAQIARSDMDMTDAPSLPASPEKVLELAQKFKLKEMPK